MNDSIEALNSAAAQGDEGDEGDGGATQTLLGFCGSPHWVAQMCEARPFANADELHAAADTIFERLSKDDWLAAFAHHPKIGDLESLKAKFAGNAEWSGGEQAGVNQAEEATLVELTQGNEDYESRFGHIFIVCATGKSAAEMLALLKSRLPNNPDDELPIAAAEQRKITHLRIDKWLEASTTK